VVSAAAHLANGFPLEEVGPAITEHEITRLPIQAARLALDSTIEGEISLIDKNYGNVWTNIPAKLLASAAISYDSEIELQLENGLLLRGKLLRSFHEVNKGDILLYINRRGYLSVAMNQESFLKHHHIHRHTRLIVTNLASARMQSGQLSQTDIFQVPVMASPSQITDNTLRIVAGNGILETVGDNEESW
jgi:S-adenosylmethionine hydrolase